MSVSERDGERDGKRDREIEGEIGREIEKNNTVNNTLTKFQKYFLCCSQYTSFIYLCFGTA